MSEERKERDLPRFGAGSQDAESKGNVASRARNRTVLLTPDAIGQVRAQMTEESLQDPMSELLPPVSWDYQQPGAAAVAAPEPAKGPDDGYLGVGRALDEVRRESEGSIRRPTGKFEKSGIGPSSPRAQSPLGHTTIMTNPNLESARGFSAGRAQTKGTTATNLRQAIAEVAPPAPRAASPKSKIVGFLISFDAEKNGEVFEIRAGRWLVTSRPTDHGDFILVHDESISPLHAIIRATAEGKVQVLDQLSEFGTGIVRSGSETEEEIAGTMAGINHGDTVRFGKRNFVVCMVPKGMSKTEEE